VEVRFDGVDPRIHRDAPGRLRVVDGDLEVTVTLRSLPEGGFLVTTADGKTGRGEAVREGDAVWVRWRGRTYRLRAAVGRKHARRDDRELESPMPGQVQKHLVGIGDSVEAGEPLLVIEAMKMQLEIKAPRAGRVKSILAAEGERVPAGAVLVELEEAS